MACSNWSGVELEKLRAVTATSGRQTQRRLTRAITVDVLTRKLRDAVPDVEHDRRYQDGAPWQSASRRARRTGSQHDVCRKQWSLLDDRENR